MNEIQTKNEPNTLLKNKTKPSLYFDGARAQRARSQSRRLRRSARARTKNSQNRGFHAVSHGINLLTGKSDRESTFHNIFSSVRAILDPKSDQPKILTPISAPQGRCPKIKVKLQIGAWSTSMDPKIEMEMYFTIIFDLKMCRGCHSSNVASTQ